MIKLLLIMDLDGTLANPGNRFKKAGKLPSKFDRRDKRYQAWLDKAQKNISRDKIVGPLKDLLNVVSVSAWKIKCVVLTSREDKHIVNTVHWMDKNKLFDNISLVMRPAHNYMSYPKFKELEIKKLVKQFKPKSVLVIDDDPQNSLRKVCLRNGWTMLKAVTSGRVP